MKMGTKPLLALLILAGCDPQATDAYEGEPLLTVQGSVELALERDNSNDLQPTIAFQGDDNLMYLSDAVAVRGEFPASFVLDVLAPPPPEAVRNVFGADDEPRIAVGFITAASPDLPRVFEFKAADDGELVIATDLQDREWICYRVASEECYRDELICDGECIVERTTCPDYPSAAADMNCTVSHLEHMKTEWEHFAGLSENYLVLYLDRPVQSGSQLAHEVGATDTGLAAGYHLIHARHLTAEEIEQNRACLDEALEQAFARYNASHGTSYAQDTIQDPFIAEEIYDLSVAVEIELRCTDTDVLFTRVEHPENESITVRIGSNIEPLTD